MNTTVHENPLKQVAARIKEMRGISGYTVAQMAGLTDVSAEQYAAIEAGEHDPSFTFLHKCALAFGVDINALLEGHTAKLSRYLVTRGGQGPITAKEEGIEIRNMAAMFRNRLATPYYVTYSYDEKLQDRPIHTTTHAGQEFDYVISGSMRIQVGDHCEELHAGDSIFYKSSTPHGMIAIGGKDVTFLAMIMAGTEEDQALPIETARSELPKEPLVASRFVDTVEDEKGRLLHINFRHTENFNFAYDIVDGIAKRTPEKLAMLHVSDDFTERKFTFGEMSELSSQAANYLTSLGIGRGDKVMLVLKRHWQFWPAVLACHKIGAVVIPATNQLMVHDFAYRFQAADVKAILCTADGETAEQAEQAMVELANVGMTESNIRTFEQSNIIRVIVNGSRPGWHSFDAEFAKCDKAFPRAKDAPGGDDPMLMFFTSGTTSYPKMALHSYKYALGHFVTAKYWHLVDRGGLHFTMSETGWGKALWGKLYGQWLCEAAIFAYDFARFDADKVLPMFAKHKITTFCAPPTIYRMLIK